MTQLLRRSPADSPRLKGTRSRFVLLLIDTSLQYTLFLFYFILLENAELSEAYIVGNLCPIKRYLSASIR